MKKLMLEHAFKEVDEVLFFIGEKNMRSRRAVEKLGAKLIDKVERLPAGAPEYFAVVYGLKEKEWRGISK